MQRKPEKKTAWGMIEYSKNAIHDLYFLGRARRANQSEKCHVVFEIPKESVGRETTRTINREIRTERVEDEMSQTWPNELSVPDKRGIITFAGLD